MGGIVIVRYPGFEHIAQMPGSEANHMIHVHRDAGLAHQILINCLPGEQVPAPLA